MTMRWLLIFVLLFIITNAAAITINEISAKTPEWIEIANTENAALDLAGFLIKDNSTSNPDTITCWTISNCDLTTNASYFLILGRNTNIAEITNNSANYFYVDDSLIGNGLGDNGDELFFYNEIISANTTYAASTAGKSWQRLRPENNDWLENTPTPGQQNFFEHDLQIALEKTSQNEITAKITNNGLSDENITLDFYIDSNYVDTQQGLVSSFSNETFPFAFENPEIGNHTATVNLTSDLVSETTELNFTIAPLPEADVYATVTINQTSNEYIVRSFPENASTYVGVSVFPHNFDGSDIIFGIFMFGEEFDTELDVSDLVAEEIDFGSYDLCAEILEIDNYNDTSLENNFICEEFTIWPEGSKKRIKTFVANENYGLNETVFWNAQVFPKAIGTIGNLTVNLQKRNSPDVIEVLKIENLNLTETLIFSGNYTIPDDKIEGIYKVRAKFSYTGGYLDSQDSGQFWLAGLKDIGPANFTVLQLPDVVNFGGFKTVFVKFFSGNYNYDKLRFLVYGYPKQVLADTSGEGISASDYSSDVAIELDGVKRGQDIYLALPAFAKQNCGEDYGSDSYRTRIRAYDADGKPVATSDISLQLSGKSAFCQQKTITSAGGSRTGSIALQKQALGDISLSITDAPEEVEQGGELRIIAKITNNINSSKTIEAYSYIFRGQDLITEGGWTANKIPIGLKGKETKEIELESTIKEDAELGTYTLRTRIKDGNKNIDSDAAIAVVEKTRSETTSAGSGLASATGAAVYVSKTSTLNPVLGLFVFLLLVLVLILIRSK